MNEGGGVAVSKPVSKPVSEEEEGEIINGVEGVGKQGPLSHPEWMKATMVNGGGRRVPPPPPQHHTTLLTQPNLTLTYTSFTPQRSSMWQDINQPHPLLLCFPVLSCLFFLLPTFTPIPFILLATEREREREAQVVVMVVVSPPQTHNPLSLAYMLTLLT